MLKKNFIFFKTAQGIASRTMKDYNRTFSIFEKYYTKDIICLQDLENALLEMFVPLSNGAPATFNIPFTSLNCFFNWATEKRIYYCKSIKIDWIKKEKRCW